MNKKKLTYIEWRSYSDCSGLVDHINVSIVFISIKGRCKMNIFLIFIFNLPRLPLIINFLCIFIITGNLWFSLFLRDFVSCLMGVSELVLRFTCTIWRFHIRARWRLYGRYSKVTFSTVKVNTLKNNWMIIHGISGLVHHFWKFYLS